MMFLGTTGAGVTREMVLMVRHLSTWVWHLHSVGSKRIAEREEAGHLGLAGDIDLSPLEEALGLWVHGNAANVHS